MATQLKEKLESLLSVPEKHKLLGQFIHTTTEADIDNILSIFSGHDFQHQNIRLQLAKKFHRVSLIIDLLKHGGKEIITKATKLPWIYNNESVLLDPVFLMNEIFPNVSYGCRWKIINNMGLKTVDKSVSDKVDVIYDSVEKQYGYFSAGPLLPGCSEKKIKSLIDSNRIKYNEQQLIAILKKYPELGIYILKNYYSNFTKTHRYRSSSSVQSYLFDHHPKEFTNLLIDNWDVVSSSGLFIGRQRSKKFIKFTQNQRKELLLNHAAKLNTILDVYEIQKQYKAEEFEILFLSSLPDNIENFDPYDNDSRVSKMLNTQPRTKRLQVLTTNFFKKYEMNLLDYPEYVSESMVALLPINSEDRMRLINLKIENAKWNNYNWNCEGFYMSPSTDENRRWIWTILKPIELSIPELTQLYINEQEVENRATLSQCLILTCFFNQNPSELLKILTLLSKRSRNDQQDVRTQIFEAFEFIMNRMELGTDHLDIILEIIQVSELYKEVHTNEMKEKILEKCITFNLKNNLPIQKLVEILFKMKFRGDLTYATFKWKIDGVSNREDEKKILLLYINELERMFTSKSSSGDKSKGGLSNCILSLMEHILKFNEVEVNRRRKNKQLSETFLPFSSVSWVIRQFLEILKKVSDLDSQAIEYSNRWDPNSNISIKLRALTILRLLHKQQQQLGVVEGLELPNENVILSKYLNASFTSSCPADILRDYSPTFFLNHDPLKLNENWSLLLHGGFLKGDDNNQLVLFMKKLKMMNYKPLIEKTIEICRRFINLESGNDSEGEIDDMDCSEKIEEKCKSITCLSILCEPSQYLQTIVPSFYPLEAKIDVNAENSEEDYELKKSVARSLIRISIPHLSFPAIEKFCVGDYLKLTVGSLYSQSLAAPEKKVVDFLRHQLETNGRVSVQKHMIRLFFKISSLKDKSLVLQKSEKEETLISNNDTNATIRHEIFLQSCNLFHTSPSQETWSIFKSRIEKLTPTDSQSIACLCNLLTIDNLCPPQFLSECIRTLLINSRRLMPFNAEHSFFQSTITQIGDIITKVDQSILDEIVLDESHESKTGFPYPRFYVVYLMNCSSQELLSHRLKNVKFVLTKAIKNNWGKISTEFETVQHGDDYVQQDVIHYKTREQVFEFIEELCKEDLNVVDKVGIKEEILSDVLKELQQVNISKIFKHSVYIQLALRHLKETEKTGVDKLKSFGASVAEIIDELVKLYGGEIITIIKTLVSSFLTSFFRQELESRDNTVEFVSGLLSKSDSRHCQIIAISLLKNLNPKKPNLKSKFDEILEKIRTTNDVAAQIFQES